MALTDSAKLRIVVALAFFAAAVALLAVITNLQPRVWAAYGIVLAMLIFGTAAFVGGARDVSAKAPRLAVLFVLNAMLFQFCLALVVAKGGLQDPDYRFAFGIEDIAFYAVYTAAAFVVAFAYGAVLDIARRFLSRQFPELGRQ